MPRLRLLLAGEGLVGVLVELVLEEEAWKVLETLVELVDAGRVETGRVEVLIFVVVVEAGTEEEPNLNRVNLSGPPQVWLELPRHFMLHELSTAFVVWPRVEPYQHSWPYSIPHQIACLEAQIAWQRSIVMLAAFS